MHLSETFSFLRRKPAHLDLTFAAEIKKVQAMRTKPNESKAIKSIIRPLMENAAEKVRHVPKHSIVGIMTSAKTFSLTLVGELSHQNV